MNLYIVGQDFWFEFYKAENEQEALKLAEIETGEPYYCELVEGNTQETETNPDSIETCYRLGFEMKDIEALR